MRMELDRQLTGAKPLPLAVGADIWDLYVFGATRVNRDWFVQLAVIGPRVCTVTVRVAPTGGLAAASHDILSLVREWLLADPVSNQAYLECRAQISRAS
jgi:hypothetical protein